MSEQFDPYRKWLGIPPEEQPPNHYRLLGIALFESDPDVISNAADRQMAHVRTFQSSKYAGLSQQVLNELAAARVCLLSRSQKARYDAQLRRQLADGQPAPPAPPVAVQEAIAPDGVALPFSTEPELPEGIAELQSGLLGPEAAPAADAGIDVGQLGVGQEAADVESRLRRARSAKPLPVAIPAEDPVSLPVEDFVPVVPRTTAPARSANPPRGKRPRSYAFEIGLAAVFGAALLAALTWVATHSSPRPEPKEPPSTHHSTSGKGHEEKKPPAPGASGPKTPPAKPEPPSAAPAKVPDLSEPLPALPETPAGNEKRAASAP